MTEEQYQSEQVPEEKGKKRSRRRTIIYIVVGGILVCAFLGFIASLFPSSDDGAPASPPETNPTAVQLPVETEVLPTDLPDPTSAPLPTAVPTEVPVVGDVQAEYFAQVVPGSLVMTNAMTNTSELFLNPRLLDDAWYDEVTIELSTLLAAAMSMEDIPVPSNCDVCRDVHNELVVIEGRANDLSLDWIGWLVDQSETAYLDSMAVHITEIGNAANRATAIMVNYLEQ